MAIDLQELATAIGKLIIRFRMRRHTTADWISLNEVLLSAEWGIETDGLKRRKIGDGTTGWNALPFADGVQTIVAGDGIDVDATDAMNPIVTNIGVLTIVPGTGITVDDTDPQNPIVRSTGGGGGGGGSNPWSDGVIMWFDTSHRAGISGQYVHFLNASEDYPGRGIIAAAAGPVVFNSLGGVGAGGTFTIQCGSPLLHCTIMAVIITPATLTFGTILAGNGAGSLQFRLDNSSGNWHLTLINAGVAGIGDDSVATTLAPSTMYLVTATFDAAGAWTLRRNGVQTAAGTSGATPTGASDHIGNSGGSEVAQHDLMEMLLYDRPLGSTDLATDEGLLMTKYSL